jgi:prophage regulatory protein
MEPSTAPRRALRLCSVISLTGISKTQVYRLVQAGKFPQPVKLSERISVWDADLVDQWLSSKFSGGQP